jgi:hypothetical protein
MTEIEEVVLDFMKAIKQDENYTLEQLDKDFLELEVGKEGLHWGKYGYGDH